MNFKRVLVTGGAGFIGSHLVDALLAAGHEVTIFDNLEPQVHGPAAALPPYVSREARFIHGDILNEDALAAALAGNDAVFHLAAMVGVGQSQYQVRRYVHANVTGTALLMDLLIHRARHVQRLIIPSSMSIYGEGLYRRPSDGAAITPLHRPEAQMERGDYEMRDPETGEVLHPLPTPETKPLYCTTVYAQSKKDQEEYSLLLGRAHRLSVTACRFFNVYGPRHSLNNPYTGATAIFCSRLRNGNPPLLYEDGQQIRDFIDVRDLVAAKLFLLNEPRAELGVYNICTGVGTSIGEICRTLARLQGTPEIEPRILNQFRAGDIRHCYGDPTRLAQLGWQPTIPLETGLRDLIVWTSQQQADDQLERAHRELAATGLVRGIKA